MASGNVRFNCPGCGKQGIAPRSNIGKEVTCPDDACGTEFAIPEPVASSFRVASDGQVLSGAAEPKAKLATRAKIRTEAKNLLAEYVPKAVALQIAEKYDLDLKEAKQIVREAQEGAKADQRVQKRANRADGRIAILIAIVGAIVTGAAMAYDLIETDAGLGILLMTFLGAGFGFIQSITGTRQGSE